MRRIAFGDGATGIAFELVASAELQVAVDRQEPAPDARGGGDRVPEVLDACGVGRGGDNGLGGLAVPVDGFHAAHDGVTAQSRASMGMGSLLHCWTERISDGAI